MSPSLLPVLLVLSCGFLQLFWIVEGASFYGASYVSVPFQEAKSTTEIHFRFKTHRSDAMLLLAAGRTDYCLIVLEAASLKVRMNLGAGEAELTSPPGLQLNDLMWHDVHLQRVNADMQLMVDTIHKTRLTIPGRFFELNIHFGVYVGGLGDFNELFLGNLDSFRGCLDNLTFNGMHVFKQARENTEQRGVHAVSWECSAEFDATSDRAFSLVENGAFLALPTFSARNGGTFSVDVKTMGNTSVIVYNGGLPSKSDFIALEMIEGKPKLSIDKGNGVVELTSEMRINDGLWHHIEVRFSPSYVEINVDEHVTNLRPSLGENRHFDLAGRLYVGGIELNKQARALAHGLESMIKMEHNDGSFKGCMHTLKLNDQLFGLREAEVTKGLKVDCVWEYPCLRDPCIEAASCMQQGINAFRCICDHPICIKSDISTGYKVYPKISLPGDLEILTLQPLHVKEGDSELITSNNIDVVLDFQKYGIRESGVLFHVIHFPEFGKLDVEIWRRPDETIFTLLDLNTDKVHYVHDGSESQRDSIMMEMEFLSRRDRFPDYLLQRHRFVLSIVILPVNDPPEIKPTGKTFRLAQNTKKTITNEILTAIDSDNGPEDLVYTVLNVGGDNVGYIENVKTPGKPVDTFTQSDIDQGLISYVHRGSGTGRITFRVSDGIETSQPPVVLRIVAFELQLYMVNNTGITVSYNSEAYILPENLTFVTNAPEQDLDIRYDITRPPQFGNLQRLRNNGRWQTVNHFTQRQMFKDKLQYVHTVGRPSHDEFKFTVSCNDVTMSTVYDFRITFLAITLQVVNNYELVLDQIQEKSIGIANLKFETVPNQTPETDIVYNIVQIPAYGYLYLNHIENHKREKLVLGSNFTQMDINLGIVNYKLNRKPYSVINDQFQFRIITPYEISKTMYFNMRHLPAENDAIITLEKLDVEEGGRAVVSNKHLMIETSDIKDFIFNITKPPEHGRLELLNKTLATVAEKSAVFFTSDDIKNNQLIYVHDDSEHNHDSFTFLALPRADEHDFQYIGTFSVHVVMKNDNPPVRVIAKVFHVVINGERLLTGQDLRYVDPDIESQPANLQYTRRGIPNGALYHINNADSQIFQFSQKDLDDRNILFKHSGPSYGRTVLWITDGQFYTTGILEIKATDPFVNLVNNTGIMVKRGRREHIYNRNLTIDTNINALGKDVYYTIISAPSHGKILLNGEPTVHFTQQDIDDERVEYENDNANNFQDSLTVRAQIGSAKAEADFEIKIFPESYWEPLAIINNKTLTVDESQTVTIDQSMLQVSHANVDPRDITYVVHTPPCYGDLEIESNLFSTNPYAVNHGTSTANIFDQATVNEGKLKYVQTNKNVSQDHFSFDVTNGVVTIQNLMFRIHVISKIILLETKNLTVKEGEKTTLTEDHISILSRFSSNQIDEFDIVVQPKHGWLESFTQPINRLVKFTSNQLKGNQVQYVHDGSESFQDVFAVVARIKASGRESLPTYLYVIVEPINDEVPSVINNTGLQVWEGSINMITSSNLAAVDEDSDPEDLLFLITVPVNGYLALANNTAIPIQNCTQAMINNRQIVFVHTGSTVVAAGGFYFQVTDGLNSDARHAFTITSWPISIRILKNERLYVFPKVRQTITAETLAAVASDWDQNREILYTVKTKPHLGRILVEENGVVKELSHFTQRQVNASLVAYEHTKALTDLTADDSFTFNIDCKFAPSLHDQLFDIEISVLKINPEGLDRYVGLTSVQVKEGEEVSLTQKNLNTSGLMDVLSESDSANAKFVPKIYMVVQDVPENGILVVGDENVTIGTIFTQENVNEGKLSYLHDHSDTLYDRVVFSVFLDSTDIGGTNVILINCTLNFTIEPVNDQKFELVTKPLRMNIVQGQRAKISPDVLKTVDPDTFPKDIRYDIINGPNAGRMALSENLDRAIHTFTQEDIDSGHLYYIHEGPVTTVTFYFKVSDGEFKPEYAVFNFHVVPLSLKMASHLIIIVPQATTAVYLKTENLGAETNGNRSHIWYNVTSQPKHGLLFMNDEVATQFRQEDIDQEHVLYMQMDMTVSEDSFSATVWIDEQVIEDQVFRVLVIPLVKQKDYRVPVGKKAVLTLDFLDASQLAEQTHSNPLYTITKRSKFGILRKLHPRHKRSYLDNEVMQFTHEDIVKKSVYYEPRDFKTQGNVNDSFEFMLTATNVQPAHGKFSFLLLPKGTLVPELVTPEDVLSEDEDNYIGIQHTGRPGHGVSPTYRPQGTSRPGGGNNEEKNASVYSPQISNDHLLIIGVAIGVVLLAAIIIVAVKCHAKRRKKQQEKKAAASKNGGPLGSSATRPECDQRPDILEQQSHASDYLTDEVPSISSRSGPTSPKLRPAIGGLRHEVMPLRATPSPSHEEDWMEVSPAVPTCKVTPLGQGDHTDVNETTLKYPYGMLEPPDMDEWGMYEHSELRFQRPVNPMLRKNQYWV